MEKSEMIIRTLMNEGKKFAYSEDVRRLCEKYGLDYKKTKKLMLNKKPDI